MSTALSLSRPFARARGWAPAVALATAMIGRISFAGGSASVGAEESCCNVVELRQYTLRPGRRELFITLFDQEFADSLDATGMTVIGQFRDLDRPDRFVWMRGFQNMKARARELAAFYDSDLWHAHRDEANASIDDSDNVLLLEPATPGLRFKDVPQRAAPGAAALEDGGLVVVTLYYTKLDYLSGFQALFAKSLRRHAEAAGARTIAAYVTSTQANNFPRLPIRVGEQIYVWVARFAGPEDYAAYQSKLNADKAWMQTLWPSAREHLARDPEILRLTPTPRSRLRG
jgi:hypothetical protein